jgi:hypothetical protein
MMRVVVVVMVMRDDGNCKMACKVDGKVACKMDGKVCKPRGVVVVDGTLNPLMSIRFRSRTLFRFFVLYLPTGES